MPLGKVLTLGALAVVVVAGAAAVLGPRLLRGDVLQFVYSPAPLSEAAYRALAARPGWRAADHEVAPGVRLRGLVRPPQRPDAPWLLFHAGNGAALLAGSQAFLEGVAAERGWGLAVWAYRGFDGSGGEPDRAALLADAVTLARGLGESERVAPGRLHVLGFSLGSAVAAQVAAALTADGRPPASLTLLAPFTVIDVNVAAWYRHVRRPDRWVAPPLGGVGAWPALVVHGAADPVLPVAQARDVAAGLGERARLVVRDGQEHASLLADPETWAVVRDFVEGVGAAP